MAIPLDKIITNTENVYEKTSIAILEASKMSRLAAKSHTVSDEKITSMALTRAMDNEVELANDE